MVNFVNAYVCEHERSLKKIDVPITKLGGIPVFFNNINIQTCHKCKQAMDFLAQITLKEPISFSTNFHMAYIFMCPGKFDERGWLECQTWEPFLGANKVILQEETMSIIPSNIKPTYPDYQVTWKCSKEPMVDTSEFDLDPTLHKLVSHKTKIGGVPAWLQNNETPTCTNCNGLMKFVAQLDAELDGNLPANLKEWGDEKYKFYNFGDSGIGYLFLCEDECGPNGAAFLWQST